MMTMMNLCVCSLLSVCSVCGVCLWKTGQGKTDEWKRTTYGTKLTMRPNVARYIPWNKFCFSIKIPHSNKSKFDKILGWENLGIPPKDPPVSSLRQRKYRDTRSNRDVSSEIFFRTITKKKPTPRWYAWESLLKSETLPYYSILFHSFLKLSCASGYLQCIFFLFELSAQIGNIHISKHKLIFFWKICSRILNNYSY